METSVSGSVAGCAERARGPCAWGSGSLHALFVKVDTPVTFSAAGRGNTCTTRSCDQLLKRAQPRIALQLPSVLGTLMKAARSKTALTCHPNLICARGPPQATSRCI